IEEGVEGLIHVSELSWTKRIMRPSDILSVGQEVEAVVLGVNKEEQKISLGLRQLEPNPWDEIEKKFTIGSNVKGKIRNMTAYGAFVELEDDIDGLVHISQLSEDHVAKVKDVLKVGQEVEARVIKVDKIERRIGLSIKAANYSEEELRKEVESFDTLRPGEDMVGLEKAFAAAEQEEYRPGDSKRAAKESDEPTRESKKK